MPSVFAAVRFEGYGVPLAWTCQGIAMVASVVLVVSIWSGPARLALRAVALVLAILLFSPHIWYYDLTLLALALAWLWQDGRTQGWLIGDQLLLIFSWILPLLNLLVALTLKWSPGPLYLVAPLILLIRRYIRDKNQDKKMGGIWTNSG